jgi:hypothetical protein
MKELYMMVEKTKETIEYAIDVSEGFGEQFDTIKQEIGEEKLMQLLQGFSRGMVYRYMDLLDTGNQNSKRDDVNWVLLKTDAA